MAVVADYKQVGVAGRVAQHLPGLSFQDLNGDRAADVTVTGFEVLGNITGDRGVSARAVLQQ